MARILGQLKKNLGNINVANLVSGFWKRKFTIIHMQNKIVLTGNQRIKGRSDSWQSLENNIVSLIAKWELYFGCFYSSNSNVLFVATTTYTINIKISLLTCKEFS